MYSLRLLMLAWVLMATPHAVDGDATCDTPTAMVDLDYCIIGAG